MPGGRDGALGLEQRRRLVPVRPGRGKISGGGERFRPGGNRSPELPACPQRAEDVRCLTVAFDSRTGLTRQLKSHSPCAQRNAGIESVAQVPGALFGRWEMLRESGGIAGLGGRFGTQDAEIEFRHPRAPADRVCRTLDCVFEMISDEGELALRQTRQGRSVVGVAQPALLAEGVHHRGEGTVAQVDARFDLTAQRVHDGPKTLRPAQRAGALLREATLEVLP